MIKPIYINENEKQVPFAAFQAFSKDTPDVVKIFDGPMAQAGYTKRDPQVRLASAVADSFRTRRHLCGEAGTGTGKSFAYLIPSILHAISKGVKVVISTGNLTLQDQLKLKDLPSLQKILGPYLTEKFGRNFSWAVLKGKSNYLCLAKQDRSGVEIPCELTDEVDAINEWSATTSSGDFAESGLNLKSPRLRPLLMSLAVVESDECSGPRKCEYGHSAVFGGNCMPCWYYEARNRAESADILVVNHSLLVRHYAIGELLLLEHDAVVVDEAHSLKEAVYNELSGSYKSAGLARLVNKCVSKLKLSDNESSDLFYDLKPLRECSERFFEEASSIVEKELGDRIQTRLQKTHLSPKLLDLAHTLEQHLGHLRVACEAAEEDGLTSSLANWMGQLGLLSKIDSTVVLSGERINRDSRGVLKVQPLDIAPFGKRMRQGKPWVHVSATLATSATPGEQFAWFKETLGIDGGADIDVGSPFDYPRQMLYFVPDLPEILVKRDTMKRENQNQHAERWGREMLPVITQLIDQSQGGTLVLCTSNAFLEEIYWRLCDWDKYPVKRQGQASNGDLVDWLKSTGDGILCATKSFWEGVDIPGDALRLVIIDRIPFCPPDDPLYQAKEDHLRSQGITGFRAWQKLNIPQATIDLKQGIGRLIRTSYDRGVVALLDPRFICKDYGRKMLQAFPGHPGLGDGGYRHVGLGFLPHLGKFIFGGPRSPQGVEEERAALALIQLASLDPDGACEQNGVGFNKFDTDFGNGLARKLKTDGRLSSKEWTCAVGLAHKYRRQVEAV